MYGYVPYWEMDEGIAAHLAETDLTTLGLFSVTHRKSGALATNERGYKLITDDLGRQMIREAHDRGVRVELVYTSFGESKNAAFFADDAAQDRTISELVALADDLGVDGINVDVELLDLEDVPAYGAFVGRLRAAIRADDDGAQRVGRDRRRRPRDGDGRGGRGCRSRPDLPHGLRLPHGGLRARRVRAARPA